MLDAAAFAASRAVSMVAIFGVLEFWGGPERENSLFETWGV
jgi:hypothetical protein